MKLHKTVLEFLELFQTEAIFPLIAQVIIESLEEGPVESYFLARNFYKFSEEIANEIPKFKALTAQMLEKEDSDLYK